MLETAIAEAIRIKKIVRFTYEDAPRTAHPYVLGLDLDNRLTLIAWEASAGSFKSPSGWMRYHLDKMNGLSVSPHNFIVSHADNPGISEVLVRVIALV